MQLALEKGRVAVPAVRDLDAVAAANLLREAGLQPRVIAEEYIRDVPKGLVAVQRPRAGARIRSGGEVQLVVSRGSEELSLPDVAGLPLVRAQRVLAEAGLAVGQVLEVHADDHPPGVVIAQDPPAGAPATRGTAVNLLVSLGPWGDRG